MSEQPGSHRDPTEFALASLGRAKTAASDAGNRLVSEFEHVERITADLRAEHGVRIAPSQIVFEDPVTQAAWLAKQGHDQGPPMMTHEDDLALSIRREA
jgi:hypothetical protein